MSSESRANSPGETVLRAMLTYQSIMRRQLDKRFSKFDKAACRPPPDGWIKTIRRALGMSTPELAARMAISQQRTWKLEQSEVGGSLRVDTLRRAAMALNCELVYLFVPNEALEDMVLRQAERKAMEETADDDPLSSAKQELWDDLDEWIGYRALELIDSRGLWRASVRQSPRADLRGTAVGTVGNEP